VVVEETTTRCRDTTLKQMDFPPKTNTPKT
jgi:hypothetical protein